MKLRYIYTILSLIICSLSASAQTTYYWKATDGSSWNTLENWFSDKAYSIQATKIPDGEKDNVVIPAGTICTHNYIGTDNQGVKVGELHVYGTLNVEKKLTAYDVFKIYSGGTLKNELGIVKACKDCYINGTVKQKQRFVVVGKLFLNGTIETLIKDNSNGFEISGEFHIQDKKSKIITYIPTFKCVSDVIFEENSYISLSKDMQFQMKDGKRVVFNGEVYFPNAASIKVGGYDKLSVNGTGIKVVFGSDCSFNSNGNSNFFVFPDMLDWQDEDVLKHFKYKSDLKHLKINLFARPVGPLTFYYQNAKNTDATVSWSSSYAWTLVKDYCVYINLASKINGSTHYYPGALTSNIDNAVVSEGKTVDDSFNVKPTSVTIDNESCLTKPDNINNATLVYVNKHPDAALDFYSEEEGVWSADAMWTYKQGKHWYVTDTDQSKYINDTYEVDHNITLDSDKTVKTVVINKATLEVPCQYVLSAQVTEINGGSQLSTGTCKSWNELTEKDANGFVTFWSIGNGKWSDYRNWSVTDPSDKITSYAGIFPGKEDQKDNVIINAGNTITLDGNYTVYSLDVNAGATLAVNDERTLTVTKSGTASIAGTMTFSDGAGLTLAGNGHLDSSTGNIQTLSGSSYIRCSWSFLSTTCQYADGKCTFVNSDDALAKYTSDNGGTIKLTSRPDVFSFAAYKTADWNENMAWSIIEGKRIFLYLNDDETNTIYPGENADGQTDSFVIPSDITITQDIAINAKEKPNAFAFAEINGTLILKDETLYPNNGTDLYLGADSHRHPIVIEKLSGSGVVNEEYDYSAKITNDESFMTSNGLYIIRKLADNQYATYYSIKTGDWNDYTVWSKTRGGSPIEGYYPGSRHNQGDIAVICNGHTITNTTDLALAQITIEKGGRLQNDKSLRLVKNDTDFLIDEGGIFEVTGTSSLSFLGDGQNIVVNGEVRFTSGILSVTGNKFVNFGENGKFTGKGGIRISYDNIIQLNNGQRHYTFQSILDCNPKLDAFLAQGGIMEMTARPNKGYAMDFYLQQDGNWDDNKEMWSIGDINHSNREDASKNYHVYVYVYIEEEDVQKYYYPGCYEGNIDYVIICKGKTVDYTIAPEVTSMKVDGTLNVVKDQTMNIIGEDHLLWVGAQGEIHIADGKTLTLAEGVNVNFAEGGKLTGAKGTLVCYSSALKYTVDDNGIISFTDAAVNEFLESGGTLIFMDRPSELLTFYSIKNTTFTWSDNNKKRYWTLQENRKVFVRNALFSETYYYPGVGDKDNVVITDGCVVNNNKNLTIKDLCVNATAKIVLTVSNIKVAVSGNLTLKKSDDSYGQLAANDGLTRSYYRVDSYNNLTFEGRADDLTKLNKHRNGEYENVDRLFETNIAKHIPMPANLWIDSHPEGSINFYSQHDNLSWSERDKFSIIPDANVYLYIEGEFYYPGRLSYYQEDAVVIPAGKKVNINDNINDVKSIGNLHVDGELLMYKVSDNAGRELKITRKLSGTGYIRCSTTSKSILYVPSMDNVEMDNSHIELLAAEFTYGYIYVTEYKEGLTYYFTGTLNSDDKINNNWNNWGNWRLDPALRRIYAFIDGKKTYPASDYDTDIAVIGVAGSTTNDVVSTGSGAVLGDKKLYGLTVNSYGTLNIDTHGLTITKEFKGSGRIRSKYVDGITAAEDCTDKTFYTNGVIFVTTNPYVFYSLKDMTGWGENVASATNDWKTDTKYKEVNWSVVPDANVFAFDGSKYYIPSPNDAAHIVGGKVVDVFAGGSGQRREIKDLYIDGGTLNICGGRLVVSGKFTFRLGEVHLCAETDEWVLNEVDYTKEDDEAGYIKITSDAGMGVMYMTQKFLMTQTSWPKAFESYHGRIYVADLEEARKYFLKSGTDWSSAVWTVDRTIDAPGQLVAPNYPGQRLRGDEVVITKVTVKEGDVVIQKPQHLTHNVNMIVKGIDIRQECSLTSAFDMSVDNYVIGAGTLTAKSLTVGGVDILEAPATYTIDKTEKDALFVNGEIYLTGTQYANGTLYAKAAGDWSTIKWSLRDDGNVYYNDGTQKPTSSNDVVIYSGTVTVDAPTIVKNLTVAAGATLKVCGGDLTVNGSLNILGKIEICDGQTLTVNGSISDGYEEKVSKTGNGTGELIINTTPKNYRTKAAGSWSSTSTWEVKSGDTWTTDNSVPSVCDIVTINHNVTIDGDNTVFIKELHGKSSVILTMNTLKSLNVIGVNRFFDDGGEMRLTKWDDYTFYAQNDGQTETNWKSRKWAVDPTRKIYSYRDKYDVPVVTVTDPKNINVVINEGATVDLIFDDSKTLNSLTVNGTLNVNYNKEQTRTITVNNDIVIGSNGNLCINDKSRVNATTYVNNAVSVVDGVELAGNVSGNGELIVTETNRIMDVDKIDIARTDNNGKILVTSVAPSVTYYSIKSGSWTATAKNDYVWSIVKGKSVVNYSGSKYNEPASTSSVEISGGTNVSLESVSKTITNLTVKKDATLTICGCRLTVNESVVVEEGGKIILCDAGTGAITTKNISGGGDIVMPRRDRLTINGTDGFKGRIGLTSTDLTFYFKNGNDCDCTLDGESCRWENSNNWQIDKTNGHIYAYDNAVGFYYPGQISGRTYNVVVGDGKSVCLNTDVNIKTLTIDGKVSVGEKLVKGVSVGESHDETKPILNVETIDGTGIILLEYSDNLDVAYYLMQAGTMKVKHYRKGVTYYLLESGGEWTDPYNWTTDNTASVRVNEGNKYPGKDKKNDSVVIPAGRVVTLNQNIMVENLTVYGEIRIKDPSLYLLVSNVADGDGKMLVQNINTSFILVDPQRNTFFANGTITVGSPCDIPGQTFGSLIIDCNGEARLTDGVHITDNLEIRSGSTLILGKDINTRTKVLSDIQAMAKNKEGLPAEYDVFFESVVGGDVIVEEGAEFKAANYNKDVRNVLVQIGGVPTWNVLKVGGSFTVDGTLNFAEPDVNTENTHHSVREVNNRAVVKFFGSKNSEFIVNNSASMLSLVCDKDESAILYVNKAEEADFDMVSYFCLPDSNYTEYPLVLNSGILRLGNHMRIKAWGASRRANGDPVGVMQYDVYIPGSNIPVYHTTPWGNSEIKEAVRKSHDGTWIDEYKNLFKMVVDKAGLSLSDTTTWYLNHNKQMNRFNAYKIFTNDLNQGLVIPANATLWIDGAEVEVGRGESTGLKSDGTGQWIGHVVLQGKLKITQGGKLILPQQSVGIIYDNPNGNISIPASISIVDGEIHTSRIYGLHGRKLDFNMEGGALYFDRKTNVNSDTYNKFYTTYGGGDIKQGKPQGCSFSMANGGDFNMSGGLIKFYNKDNAQMATISALDLNNCGGQITGGTIAFADTTSSIVDNFNYSIYLGNHKLHNLTVTTKNSVVFHGNRLDDDGKRGYEGASLYVNGNLTINKNDENRVLVPENLYVGGNMYITQTGKKMPIFGSYGDLVSPAPAPNLYIIGDGDKYMELVANDQDCVPLFNSLIINKSSSNYSFTIKGKPVFLLGDLEVKKGELITSTNKFGDYRDGVIIGNSNPQKFVAKDQSISVSVDGNVKDATISIIDNPTNSNIKVLSDVVVKNFYSDVARRILLGSNNFKILNELKMSKHGETSMFVCSDEYANGGLTLRANMVTGNILELPVGVSYTNEDNSTTYSYTRCKATAAESVNGYLTAIPCNNYHPAVPVTSTATKFYWRMKWDGTPGEHIFSYDFRLPTNGNPVAESQTKRCGDHNCSHSSHNVERNNHPADFEQYTHYYQYHNLKWYDCTSAKVDKGSGDGVPTLLANEIMSPNGDFTDGYHFNTNEPQTYYSIQDGEWSDVDSKTSPWSLKEDAVETPTHAPTVADKVVIRNGNTITTNAEATKAVNAAQVKFVSSGDKLSTLIVAPTTKNNSVAYIIGEGKLIYDVDFDAERVWSTDSRLKEVNFLNGDHTEFCENTSSYLVYRNNTKETFILPSVIRSYPNLVIDNGEATINTASAPQGITINGDLQVTGSEFWFGGTTGRKNRVRGNVIVDNDATLRIQNDIDIDGNVDIKHGSKYSGDIYIQSGTTQIYSDIIQNGGLTVSDATLAFVGAKESSVSGNKVTFGSNSLLVVSKDDESLNTYFGSELKSSDVLNTSFTRGEVIFGNADTKITLANYSNGSRSNCFDIPSSLTLDVEAGDITLWGTDAQSVRLDGSLVVSSDSKLSTANGLGYTSGGTAKLTLTGTSTFTASQIAPCGESGKLNYSQTSNAKVIIEGNTYDTRYGRLDIRGGRFSMATGSSVAINAVADGNTPTVYYAPGNSDINSDSSIDINIPEDAEHPLTTAYIYSEYPLQGMSVGEFTDVNIKTNPLTFNSKLTIDGSLTTNGLDLTLNGDLELNGSYVHGNNTTIFSGSENQSVSGSAADVQFYNLEKSGSASVNMLLSNPTVTKTMRVSSGNVSMGTSPLKFTGDELFVNYGASITDNGVWFNGSSQQNMYCEGTISNLNIDNTAGVNAATMQSNPINISNGLTLTSGVLRIGSNLLVLESAASVNNGNAIDFGTSKMISTNLSLADKGVHKYVANGATGNILLPIGKDGIYSPVTIGITSLSSVNGYFEVRPINDYYLGVSNQTYDGSPIKKHILDFNWYVNSNGITNYNGTVTFEGSGVNVYGNNHTHQDNNYVVAVYFDGETKYDRASSASNIESATDHNIKFTYTFSGSRSVGGFYLAGCYNAIPEYPKAYISVTDGVLTSDDPSLTAATWKEYDLSDSSIKESAPFTLTSSKIYGSHIIIASDVTLATNEQRLSSVNIEEGGILRVGKTRAHYFGVVSGTGTLQLESGNMPSANYDRFLDKTTGGTLEFAGNTEYNILYSFTQVRNLKLSGTGKREFMSAKNIKLDINGDYTIDGPVAYSDADIRLHRNMNVNSGSFAGTGKYIFCGTDAQTVTVTPEDLTLSGVEVANANGVTVNKPLNISKQLTLTNGKLTCDKVTLTSYNAKISGNASSYIDGWLYREMISGNRYEYYIGEGDRYGRGALEVSSRGTWGVKFHNHTLIDEEAGYSAESDKGVPLSLNKEYWEVTRSSASGNALVTVIWDGNSTYNGTQDIYQAYYSTNVVPETNSTWKEALTISKSGTSTSGEATLKNSTTGFDPAGNSLFFAIGKKIAGVKVWLGKTDDWFDVVNWEEKRIPIPTQDVYISTIEGEPNPVIRYSNGKIAQANTIWINGSNSHLTIENGGRLITDGSIVVEDKNNCHITIKHHYKKMCTLKINRGYIETKDDLGKRSNGNTYDKVRVELTMQKGRYNYIGSATVAGTLSSEKPTVFYQYNIDDDQYASVDKIDSDFSHAVVAGMSGSLSNEWTMTQVGKVMASGKKDLTVKGVKWESGSYRWDLLSNPFTLSFPLNSSAISYSSNIDPVIWFRCFDSNLTQFYFSTYSLNLKLGVATGKNAVSERSGYIAPQQAFFIRPLSGDNGTIIFDADKVNGNIQSSNLKSTSIEPNDVLRLVVSSQDKNTDEVAFVFRDGGSKKQVYGDAAKMTLAKSQNQIYGFKDGKKMVIPYYPEMEEMENEMIPLGVVLAESSSAGVIKATNMMEFDDEYNVYLHDYSKNVSVNLRHTPEYSFDISEGALNGRFALSLHSVKEETQEGENGEVATSVTETSECDVVMCKCDDSHVMVIPTGDDDAVVTVYDIIGRVVNRKTDVSTSTRVALGEAKGVYIVEYISKKQTKTIKVVK